MGCWRPNRDLGCGRRGSYKGVIRENEGLGSRLRSSPDFLGVTDELTPTNGRERRSDRVLSAGEPVRFRASGGDRRGRCRGTVRRIMGDR